MFQLSCTVRDCGQSLEHTESGLRCTAGHCFDRAKQGYFNLLQPQDSRSARPGDSDVAVEARLRWLQRGHMQTLVDMLGPWCAQTRCSSTPMQIADLGCGEGTFGAALFRQAAENYCGIDLSRRAIRFATKRLPDATWVQANADRRLPAMDASLTGVLSLFGRRPAAEIKRTLAPEGVCIVAVPGPTDLIELREQVQQAGHQRSRTDTIRQDFVSKGLQVKDCQQWTHQVTLDNAAIADALAMTYRGVRNSQQQRIAELDSMEVTLNADLLLFTH